MCRMNRCAVGVANFFAVALHCVLFRYPYFALSRRHWTTTRLTPVRRRHFRMMEVNAGGLIVWRSDTLIAVYNAQAL